jgi:hypothetical protein
MGRPPPRQAPQADPSRTLTTAGLTVDRIDWLGLDIYGHLWPGDDDRIRQAVTAAFALG